MHAEKYTWSVSLIIRRGTHGSCPRTYCKISRYESETGLCNGPARKNADVIGEVGGLVQGNGIFETDYRGDAPTGFKSAWLIHAPWARDQVDHLQNP